MQYWWRVRRVWNRANQFRIGKYTSNTLLKISAHYVNGWSVGLIGVSLIINHISHLQYFFHRPLCNTRFWCTSSCWKPLAIALDCLHEAFLFTYSMKHIKSNIKSYHTELYITRDFWTETCNLDFFFWINRQMVATFFFPQYFFQLSHF